jgi:hypothetical protein
MKLSVLGVPYQESGLYDLVNHCTANEPISSFRLIVRDFVYTQIRPYRIKKFWCHLHKYSPRALMFSSTLSLLHRNLRQKVL